jgi:hypothetical protein
MGPRVNRRGNETLPLGQAGDCLPGQIHGMDGNIRNTPAFRRPRLKNFSNRFCEKHAKGDTTGHYSMSPTNGNSFLYELSYRLR